MDFKKWYLNEVGTSSSCVAVFARPIFGGMVSRDWPPMIASSLDDEDEVKKKKEKEKEAILI